MLLDSIQPFLAGIFLTGSNVVMAGMGAAVLGRTRVCCQTSRLNRAYSTSSTPSKIRVAIVGAGPSGFYAASRLLTRLPDTASVDIFDRLPTPHGLVRYGVAPDHPDVKNVEHKFETVSQDPRLRFAGNVNVVQGEPSASSSHPYPEAVQLPLETLTHYYTHILFSYGSSSGRPLDIPGSAPGELANVHTALSFVNWYNGHPLSHDTTLGSTQHIDLADKRHMTVIGAGNVALDVARIVLRSSTPFLEAGGTGRPTSNHAPGLSALEETDVPEPVLAELARCKVEHVDIFARRGPAQLAFTNKEVREMLSLEGIALRPPDKELLHNAIAEMEQLLQSKDANQAEEAARITSEVRVKKRLLGLLEKGSKTPVTAAQTKTWALNFFRSPARFLPREGSMSTQPPPVGGVEWNVTKLQSGVPTTDNLDASSPGKSAWGSPWSTSPAATGQTELTSTDLIVSSVGYRSEPLWSAQPTPSNNSATVLDRLPFDTRRNIVPNTGGRVVNPSTGAVIPRTYVSGWLANGPVGVIASTMMDAYSVADTILHDIATQTDSVPAVEQNDLLARLQASSTHKIVSFADWRKIDQEELRRGKQLGKLREKILTIKEMLEIAS